MNRSWKSGFWTIDWVIFKFVYKRSDSFHYQESWIVFTVIKSDTKEAWYNDTSIHAKQNEFCYQWRSCIIYEEARIWLEAAISNGIIPYLNSTSCCMREFFDGKIYYFKKKEFKKKLLLKENEQYILERK